MKLPIVSFFLLFVCLSLYSCGGNEEGLLDNTTIDTGYIVWSETGKKQPEKSIIVSPSDNPYVLTTPESFSLEVFSFSTRFIINTYDENMSIVFGKEFGYMKITPDKVCFCDETYICEDNLMLPLATGTEYTLKITKMATDVRFEIIQEEAIIYEREFNIKSNRSMGLTRGKPVFIMDNGSFHIIHAVLETVYHAPLVNVFGDSFVEGISLIDNGLSLDFRWVAQLSDSIRTERCLIDGKGGEKISREFVDRVMYINSVFKSKYVLLSIGTNNDSDISDCIDQMKTLSAKIKANGQIPVFATVTTRFSDKYRETAGRINDWIRSSGDLFIDMQQVVSKADNPGKWMDGYVLSDGIHPSPLAYEAMYEQLKNTCPFLFE